MDTTVLPPLGATKSAKPAGALVLGGDYQGLGIVRSLGRAGVPVCVIDDQPSIARYSRYATHSVCVGSLLGEGQTIGTVLDIGRKLGLEGWVLYPTRDENVAALSRHRAEVAAYFRVPTPDWRSIQYVWDKRNTYSLANALNIPIPQTWYPSDLTDLEQINAEAPFAIKPAIKEHFFYATKAKAWRADSRDQLKTLFHLAANQVGRGEVIIQDLIPGDGQQQFAYCAFFKNGQAVASMTVCRRRQFPAEFGRSSTYVETVDLPVLEQLSVRFLRAIDYYGLVEIEYKLDPRDGQYKLLDVNGRTWGYHTLGARAGVDFSRLLYSDQLGESVEVQRGRIGVRWVRAVTDIATSTGDILRGRQKVWEYMRSLGRADVEAVFSRDDLLPGLAELALLPYLSVKRGFWSVALGRKIAVKPANT